LRASILDHIEVGKAEVVSGGQQIIAALSAQWSFGRSAIPNFTAKCPKAVHLQ
jgi:hypothetical protein